MVYIVILKAEIVIHLLKVIEIVVLYYDKVLRDVLAKYCNYTDIFY